MLIVTNALETKLHGFVNVFEPHSVPYLAPLSQLKIARVSRLTTFLILTRFCSYDFKTI